MAEISVIIASRGRPRHLRRCVFSLFQMAEPLFELVIVADAAGVAALDDLPFDVPAKRVAFDEPNLARARNLGISVAGGDVLAFLDDDAVAEPLWLARLSAALSGDAVAATGAVIGRNGFSYQTRGEVIDARAVQRAASTPGPHEAVKLSGTNMALTRAALERHGGFDEAFAFYLEDSDLSWRLREERVALVPDARVHHASAPSERRDASRLPLRLFDVGRSLAIYLRRHCDAPADALTAHRADQRRRLLGHMQRGSGEPRDVRRLLRDLDAGISAGLAADLGPVPDVATKGRYQPWLRSAKRPSRLRVTHRLHEKQAFLEANAQAEAGCPCVVLSMTRTAQIGRAHV